MCGRQTLTIVVSSPCMTQAQITVAVVAARSATGREISPLKPPAFAAGPAHTKQALAREHERLILAERQIKDIERAQASAIKAVATPQRAAEEGGTAERGGAQAAALVRLKGIGQISGVPLCREVFYRHFNNRRELASYFGLPP